MAEDGLHLKEQEAIIAQCEEECTRILAIVDADVLGVKQEHFVRPAHETRSKVGLMLKNCVVDNVLAGSPASMSKKFLRGDTVVEIDGVLATKDNVIELLVGDDVPGTIVQIKVERPGFADPVLVCLKRACTEDLADKKQMADLLSKIREVALSKSDDEALALAHQTIQLWNHLGEAGQVHDETIVSNVQKMQADADASVRKLRALLEKLHSLSLSILSCSNGVHITEATLLAQLSQAKLAASRVQREAG